ncbi:outer membrane protein assembly factor BamE [Candidatus Pantoea carbekii]|uniref:Outer membrane protein assembly factor BamE n=1 Tax=Candidatus Pantoea carbekii TaxID=1235990 RepID=U3U7V3_9GAMM|nr:outer membrane protein assembly factor BamE [Candidatus Pantoea carbekii]AKC31880.1 lipoprotein [Candidatus Pantoea carbekii]BAO00394.1 hypothetical protein HHS_04240 [Candidatus Pantoea carbekii]
MYCKISAIFIAVILSMTVGCSNLRSIVYYPDINQGNYLVVNDLKKIHIGMTKQQIAYILGTPILQDSLSNNNIWYYIFRQELNHKLLKQQIFTLIFNDKDILKKINDKTFINKNKH